MMNFTASTGRSGQSSVPQGAERMHTLVILVNNRPGAVDRVVGLLRRRRAHIQALALSRSELPEVMRITAQVTDSDVEVDHLVEQLRKVVDVQQVTNLTQQQAVTRELALIKVNSSATTCNEIIECGHLFGASVVDITAETVILEVTGNEEKVDKLVALLQEYGIREVARSVSIALARENTGAQ